ncbi:cadherin domain-containing protein, partial [Photobacterium sp. SDRW27]|uniref:cadherin domain-containing protein n=1 Tax=Photobacterium obscurum TaxID=2829490 RepID=UPI00224435E1
DGEWTYTLDQSKVQQLAKGEEVEDTITFKATDGTEQQITVNITGTNDAPVIDYPGMTNTWISESYQENSGKQSVFSDVSITDIDSENLSRAIITITADNDDNGENAYDPLHDSFTLPDSLADKFVLVQNDYTDPAGHVTGVWYLEPKAEGNLPKAEFEAALKALQYENTADEPVGVNAKKSIGLDVYDDHGASSNRLSVDLDLVNTNEAPEFISGTNNTHGLDSEGQADVDSYRFTVNENAAGAEIGQVAAFDPDAEDKPTYTLTSHTDLFEIDSETGVISLKEGVSLDHESLDSYTLSVEVSDTDGLKDTATVEVAVSDINEAPDAVQDQGIVVETKTLDESNWDTSDDIKVDYYVIDTATGEKVADATKADFTGEGSHEYGVSSELDNTQSNAPENWTKQLAHVDGKSEAMSFSFEDNQLSNHVDVSIGNLWKAWEHEQGVWKAYYQGSLVATGVFDRSDLAPAEAGGSGHRVLGIDTGNQYFDNIEFSAIEYGDGVQGADSSDYFITKVEAKLTTFDQAYQTHETGSLAIDVLGNDTDPENDRLTIIDYPKEGYVTLQDGKLVFDAAEYMKTLAADDQDLKAGEVRNVEFEYTIEDEHGLTDTAKVTVTLIGETIVLNDGNALLHESDLVADGSEHVEGQLTADLGSAETAEYQFDADQSFNGLTSGGQELHYEVSSDGHTLKGYVGEGDSRVEVLEATIDGGTGSYNIELHTPLDHQQQGQDELTLDLNVTLTAGAQTDSAVLHVDVVDTVPEATPQHHTISDIQPQSNSVVIALDLSDSMGDKVTGLNGEETTRWQLAQDSIKTMFEQYDELGDVQFKITTFAGRPESQTSNWISSTAELEDFFSGVSPFGPTPYYKALDQLGEILDDADSQQVMAGSDSQFYFISDGNPTDFRYDDWTRFQDNRDTMMAGLEPEDVGGQVRYDNLLRGFPPTEAEQKLMLESAMEKELTDHNQPFDNIWSLGVGSGASLEYLTSLATDKGSAIVVEDDAKFADVLISSVPGQLQDEISSVHGAEAQWVETLHAGDDTYQFDQDSGTVSKLNADGSKLQVSDTPLLTVETESGRLVMNFETGKYDYQAKNVTGNQQDTFDVTLIDADGDVVDSQIVIDVLDRAPEFISPDDANQERGTDASGMQTDDSFSFDVAELESGVMVGKVEAFDPDSDDKLSYELVSGDADKFEINQSTGEIWLKEGVELDYDQQQQYQLKVEVSDGTDTDVADVTVNVSENHAPESLPVHGYAEVQEQPINKITVVFDFSSSMTRTFDGTNTIRDHSNPDEVLAPRYESRAYLAAEALHNMIGNMIAEGGESNTYIRLVEFGGEAQKLGWFELNSLYDQTKPPELGGRELTDPDYLMEVNSYVSDWCWIDSRGLNTDYAQALESVMQPDGGMGGGLGYPWQDGLDENGEFDWDLYLNEQPVDSVDTIFFMSDGSPNPKEGAVAADDLDQRWQEYIEANDAKVYGIGIATEGNEKVDEALHQISDEVVYVGSGADLSHYLNHFSPEPVAGELLAGSTDADGDALTVSLDASDFSLLGADLHGADVNGPLVTDTQLIEGKLNVTTVFGTLEVAANGSYSFTQSETSPLTDGQQADLKFLFEVQDGKGGVSDNVFTLTLTGGTGGDNKPIEVEQNAQSGDEQANILTGTDNDDILLGQGGEDTLDGGAGNDILVGGSGDDTLIGGLGDDILTGGEGSDVFTWHASSLGDTPQNDVITDFQLDTDKLDLTDILPDIAEDNLDMNALLGHLEAGVNEDGNVNLTITEDSGQQQNILLDNVDLSALSLDTGASSSDIVNQLFQHQAFKTD